MKRLGYAVLVLGVLGSGCAAEAAGRSGPHLQSPATSMPSAASVTVAEGKAFGKTWKITASWDQNQGWCVQLDGGWGSCSPTTWRDGHSAWLPDAQLGSDQVVVGAVPVSAKKVILRLEDGRDLHARIYPVPKLPAPFVVYEVAAPNVTGGDLIAFGTGGREIVHIGFASP